MKDCQISHPGNISWIHRKIWKCKAKGCPLEYSNKRATKCTWDLLSGNESPGLWFLNGGSGLACRTELDSKIFFIWIKYLLAGISDSDSAYWAAAAGAQRCCWMVPVHPVGTGLHGEGGSSWIRGTLHSTAMSTGQLHQVHNCQTAASDPSLLVKLHCKPASVLIFLL